MLQQATVKTIKKVQVVSNKYDIEVEQNHNFFANGILVHNSEGSDITDNIRAVESIPTVITSKKIGELFEDEKLAGTEIIVRGEIYIPRSFFNAHLKGIKANARNAASGVIQCQNPQETANSGLQFKVWGLFINGEEPDTEDWKEELVNDIKGFHGIKPVNFEFVELHDEVLTANIIEALDQKRKSYDYETDGIVITINDRKQREKYGWNGLKPQGRVAFKYKAEQAVTSVKSITWQPGRTGRLTPVAELEPVFLAGSTISRCSLHNAANIKRLDIAIGDKVQIEKGGDIIPQVVKVLERIEERMINYPETCPVCGQFTAMDSNNVNVWCESPSCSSKLQTKILHYLGVLGIKEIGPAMIDMLIEQKLVTDIDSLYYLDEDQIVKLPRSGLSTAQTVLNAIESVDEIELATFLTSLGIDNLGNTIGKVLAKQFKTLAKVKTIEKQDLVGIPGIGDIIADSIVAGIKANIPLIEKLEALLKIKEYEEVKGAFTGKKFCCTGELTVKRKEVQKIIESKGGEYKSISKGLTALIVGEGAVQSKIDKAKSLGAEIWTEDTFLEQMK